MELYLKKFFWIIPLLVIAASTGFLASSINHVIEAKFLLGGDDDSKKEATYKRRPRPRDRVKESEPTKDVDANAVIARNVFCSTCMKEEEPVLVPEPVDQGPQPTTLPLTVLATSVASRETLSSATILNTQSYRSGAYWLHDTIPEAGEIIQITRRYVDFRNASANRVERIDLLGQGGVPPPKPGPVAHPIDEQPVRRAGADADLLAEVDRGVKKIGDNKFEIERSLVDKVLADPNMFVKSGARIVPAIKDGKANGFKMYAIRPNSVYSKIGFQNGDTVHSINGCEFSSPDKALECYTKLKSAGYLSIQLTRRGQPVTQEYAIK